MFKVRLTCLASIALLALCASSASAQSVVLLSDTVGNGSFDVDVDATNTTGGNSFQVGASGGTRAAITGNGTLSVPGWTFTAASSNVFAGINHSDSTPAQDGDQSVVLNNSGLLTGISDAINVAINPGDQIQWSAFFGLSQDGLAAYNLSLFFDGSTTPTVILPTQGISTLGYVQESDTYVHAGPAASSVQIGFVLNTNGGAFAGGTLSGQAQADNFDFTLISATAVPEPSTLGLLGLVGLAAATRRRRK